MSQNDVSDEAQAGAAPSRVASQMTGTAPRVSVIMPTYNRADTIVRAVASVRNQAFQNWELIVVDDGSTDETESLIAGIDPRLRVIRQENQGVTAARNAGLAVAGGQLLAFLDSDDEWLPHHLALAVAFFDAFPEEHVFTSEFWEDFGNGEYVKHYRPETAEWAPLIAKQIGSSAFRTQPLHGDPYLWFYETRAPVGEWARLALAGTTYGDRFHYRGCIFSGWRWEFLMSMQSTVLTRAAFTKVGYADPAIRVASDYAWLATVCRNFTTNMVSIPGCIKHEYTVGRRPLTQGHLVTGPTAVRFHEDMLRIFDELFWRNAPHDPELQGIRAYRHLKIAEAALLLGQRGLAIEHLRQALPWCRGLNTRFLLLLARFTPSDAASRRIFALSRRALSLPGRVLGRMRRWRARRRNRGGSSSLTPDLLASERPV